jgi:tetrahydromethanopterin S-methyltransferase subunit E
MAALFHAFCALMLCTFFALFPGSIILSLLICLFLAAAAIGAKASGADTEHPLKWLLLVYGLSTLLGGIINTFIILIYGNAGQ